MAPPSQGWPRLQVGAVLMDSYKILQLIGEGGYGSVYEAQKLPTNELYALKVQWLQPRPLDNDTTDLDKGQWRLKMDVQVLRALRQCGFAKAHCKYVEWGYSEELSYLVTSLGGPDLRVVRKQLGRRFTLRSAIFLGEQIFESIHELHRAGYIYRDVKPQNFVVGREGDFRSLYMVDMGLCRRWTLEKVTAVDFDQVKQPKIRPPRIQAGFRGSLRYASVAAHREHDVGRVDDLWQWFFMLVEFTVDSLPWDQELRTPGVSIQEQMKRVKSVKERTVFSSTQILEGCPNEYSQIRNHLKSLKYFDRPDYRAVISILQSINRRKQYTDLVPLDWDPKTAPMNIIRQEKAAVSLHPQANLKTNTGK